MLVHVTNFAAKYGKEAEEGAKRAAEAAVEEPDTWSEEEDDDPFKDQAPPADASHVL